MDRKAQKCWYLLGGIVFLISLAAITNGSMWGDELCRVEASINGDFVNNWIAAMGFGQPGYMLWMYFWIQFVGKTEFILRTNNLCFVLIAFCYACKIIKKKKCSPFFVLLFFIHPMFIYYMDEVTPYIPVYAFSIAFIYYVFYTEQFESKRNIVLINVVFLTGVFIHFVFGFIYVLYIYQVFSEKSPKKALKHFQYFKLFCVFYIPLFVLDCYGLFFLGPTTRTGFGIKNIMYICYAFLGFSGLGISRNDLRAGNFDAIDIRSVISIGILLIILIGMAIVCFIDRKRIKFSKIEMIRGTILYFAVFSAFSIPLDFGLWERHCMGVLPVYIIMIIDLFEYLLSKGNYEKILMTGYCICFLISGWNIRFNYYYACDDWKSVSEYLVNQIEQNKEITIIASTTGGSFFDAGQYYDITKKRNNDSQRIINLQSEAELEREINSRKKEDKLIIILFEKSISPDKYTAYDSDLEFCVNDSYNSFKIVENAK